MKSIVIILCFIVSFSVKGQIATGEKPFSFNETNTSRKVPPRPLKYIEVLPPNLDKVKEEDKTASFYRISVAVDVLINSEKKKDWKNISGGGKLWKVAIRSKGALSIDFTFDKFWLPEGGKFFVYNPQTQQYIGAVTSEFLQGNKENPKSFSTGLIYGDTVILEYYHSDKNSPTPIISVNRLYYGYRNVNIEKTGLGSAGNCQVNVNCKEGDDWQKEKKAVARILIKFPNAAGWCSGTLVNNTAKNQEPLFLTANHCLQDTKRNFKYDAIDSPDVSTWIFYWDYESPYCSNEYSTEAKSTVGAQIVANNDSSDFALLKLIQDPRDIPKRSSYYLGWDRITTYIGNEGACIHHPSGDVKKISFYKTPPRSTYYLQDNINNNGTHWEIIWDKGVTEGGSSGSPLLNKSKRIIGQLHGGYSSCTEKNSPDWYGRFDVSWTGNDNPDKRRRLKDWLDPYNTKQQTLDGIDYIPPVPYNLTSTNTMPWGFCKKAIFKVENFPLDEKNATIDWKFPRGSRMTKEIAKNEVEIDFGTNYRAEVHAVVNTQDYKNLDLMYVNTNNNYVRSDMLCLKVDKVDSDSHQYWQKMEFWLDENTQLSSYQRQKIINLETNGLDYRKEGDKEYIRVKGSNPYVKATITLAPETCPDEHVTFMLEDIQYINDAKVVHSEEGLAIVSKPKDKIDDCTGQEEVKGEVFSNGWQGARRYYFDFYKYKHPYDYLDEGTKYKTSAPTSRVSTGYFEIVPAKGYITAHQPMKIQATPNGAELFIDSPRYVGYQEWGKAWIRYVPEDCKASKWELWDFSKAGYATNGYFIDRDKGYSPGTYSMYPNPATSTVFFSVRQPQAESRREVSLFSAQKNALQNEPYQIEVFNTAGVRVLHQEGKGTTAEFSVAHLPAGIYIVHFTQNGVTHKEKLIVE
nr:T9SS type A sorting domain-containing protein [uncultured Capnocytophaga sp.]